MRQLIKSCFAAAKRENRAALGIFVTAGDPNLQASEAILNALAVNGADFIELGMPFSDPMADGPAIQASSLRAIKDGMTLQETLMLASSFKQIHPNIPLILMGYFNPIYVYGQGRFIEEACEAGVDGLIIVDLPPEEDAELCDDARKAGLDFIRLVTPTTIGKRLPFVLEKASGFVYYVAISGITGTKSASIAHVTDALLPIRQNTNLPIVTGFGIRTPEQAAEIAAISDGVVVGSAMVSIIEQASSPNYSLGEITSQVGAYCASLAAAMKR